MTLYAVTLSAAALLLVFGAAMLWSGPPVERAAKAFPRSQVAAYVFFGAGTLWFLNLLNHLGSADFGDYKRILVAVFAAIGLGAFFVAKDFLAVRGVAVLLLLAARPALDASMIYTPPPGTRVWLNAFVYVMIVLSIYLGAAPYHARDMINWLFVKPGRARVLGAVCAGYGLALAGLAMSYQGKY
ncbi:MAG TPA: hypothetical protein VK737_06180 [Opitutales bacterium]|jgi:hypothetical protein|nr:hypothetical protein [Opitutales bacterium]